MDGIAIWENTKKKHKSNEIIGAFLHTHTTKFPVVEYVEIISLQFEISLFEKFYSQPLARYVKIKHVTNIHGLANNEFYLKT